ncbi:hypothetical protein V6Z12_D06G219700 [Gossypium hirsutum]|uniref:Protein PSK SIMULATOR 1 isoform X4 n=1 Tax=Gossypium hirsutum TaxID=3635 RepID=A0ABM3AB52_GOSHI|nr:protein PSK SIMULATOR 1-like isoform X4 [Gossypium hirsutum]
MSIQVEGDSLAILKADLKSQRKQVRNLKKKSLWSRSLEEVMEKLVDIVHYLILEIHCAFGSNGTSRRRCCSNTSINWRRKQPHSCSQCGA